MEITNEVLDDLKADIESSTPDWLGEVEVFPRYARTKGAVEFSMYFNFQRTGWVKIRANKTSDGEIDEWCNMRSDWELNEDAFKETSNEAIKKMIFDSTYISLADLILCPTDGDSSDPLLHYGDRARFLPRDETRRMILTGLDYFAPRIAKHSPFREEDWYKDWEASRLDSEPDT